VPDAVGWVLAWVGSRLHRPAGRLVFGARLASLCVCVRDLYVDVDAGMELFPNLSALEGRPNWLALDAGRRPAMSIKSIARAEREAPQPPGIAISTMSLVFGYDPMEIWGFDGESSVLELAPGALHPPPPSIFGKDSSCVWPPVYYSLYIG